MIRQARGATLLTVLLAAGLALVSCTEIQEPVVTMTGVDFHGISTDGLAFDLLVDVRNPNDFGADISGLEYRILLDDIEVATGTQEDSIGVPADSTVEVDIPFTIVWGGMEKGLKKLLDGKEHDWRLKGKVRLNKGPVSRVFRFSEGGRYKAPEADNIEIDLDL